MNLRYGTIADAEMLAKLGAKTFYDTFAIDNTPEDMDLHLKKSFSPESQFNELSAPENIFLIIEAEGDPIGFAQLILDSREETIKGIKTLEIRRIYATQENIGKGVGKELMSASIQEA